MSRNTADGDLIVSPIGAIISEFWASTAAASTSAIVGQLAATATGGSTGAIYHWVGDQWVDTGAVVSNLYGA